jgi:hypothetical protein
VTRSTQTACMRGAKRRAWQWSSGSRGWAVIPGLLAVVVTRSVPPADGDDDEAGVVEQPISGAIQKPDAVVHHGRLPDKALHQECRRASPARAVASICRSTRRSKTRLGRYVRSPRSLKISYADEAGSDSAHIRSEGFTHEAPLAMRFTPVMLHSAAHSRDSRRCHDAEPVPNDALVRELITRSSAKGTVGMLRAPRSASCIPTLHG